MQTKATFSSIRKTLQASIEESNSSIKVAVAWFTSKDLIGSLNEKLKMGCSVEVIISDDIINKRLPTKDFILNGGNLLVLPSKSGRFLHEKFALLDDAKIVTGSYNWTNFAEYRNHESVITSNEQQLVSQFNFRFEKLKRIVQSYRTELLDNVTNATADANESLFEDLENELLNEFMATLQESKNLKANIDTIFVSDFLYKYGAIGGANKLIQHGKEKMQAGLIKLWEAGRLDLSFEAIILKEKYRVLFEDEILKKAQEKIDILK